MALPDDGWSTLALLPAAAMAALTWARLRAHPTAIRAGGAVLAAIMPWRCARTIPV